MKRRLVFVLCILFATCHTVKAQIDAQYSQYNHILSYYNAAAIGRENTLQIQAIHKMQWVGVSNAPQSFFIAADMPVKFLKRKHGIGISFFNDAIGLYKNQSFALQYGYKCKLWGGELTIAPQLGLYDQSFDASKIHIPSSDYHESVDEGIPTGDARGMAFDLSMGAFYTHKNLYVGLSSTHLLEPRIELSDKVTTYLPRAYYLVTGYNISLKNTLFELQPSLMVKSDFVFTQVDVTLRTLYNKMFSGGISYRHGDAVVIMLGVKIKNVQVGYAYDIITSKLSKMSSGSHEIMLNYNLDLKYKSNRKNKHKSVRIL